MNTLLNTQSAHHHIMNQQVGYLEIILGPMFAGKTTKLVEIYELYKLLNLNICVINWDEDKRYSETMLSTHDRKEIPCVWLNNLIDAFTDNSHLFEYDIYLVNEAQFFPDLKKWTEMMVDSHRKKVYLAGLDGDFKREKFGEVLDLIPHADKVTKMNSLCVKCKNGNNAIFTKRTTDSTEQKVIGQGDIYQPVCRTCYLDN